MGRKGGAIIAVACNNVADRDERVVVRDAESFRVQTHSPFLLISDCVAVPLPGKMVVTIC